MYAVVHVLQHAVLQQLRRVSCVSSGAAAADPGTGAGGAPRHACCETAATHAYLLAGLRAFMEHLHAQPVNKQWLAAAAACT